MDNMPEARERPRFVLCVQGGLGDHLVHSTLPEELTRMGYDVFTSHSSLHRNLEIYELVWGSNPYVLGHVQHEPAVPLDIELFAGHPHIQRIEMSYGVHRTGNLTPRLYRQHSIIPELSGKTLVHLQYITAVYDPDWLLARTRSLLGELGVDESDVLEVDMLPDINTFGANFRHQTPATTVRTGHAPYPVSGIHHHCDVIASCARYITVHSGASALASAVGNRDTWVIMGDHQRQAYEAGAFVFPNLNYVV